MFIISLSLAFYVSYQSQWQPQPTIPSSPSKELLWTLSIIRPEVQFSSSIGRPHPMTTNTLRKYLLPVHLELVCSRASNFKTSSKNHVASQPPTLASSFEQISHLLAQLALPASSVTIRDSMVNGINNTSGGLIVRVNNEPRGQWRLKMLQKMVCHVSFLL